MAFNFQVRDCIVELTFHGKVTADDFRELMKLFQDLESRLPVSPDRISDLSDASLTELSSDDLVKFAASRGRATLKNKIKSAIIAPGPGQFGLSRMFMAYNHNPDIEIKIFKDSAGAYDWIGLEEKSVDKPNA